MSLIADLSERFAVAFEKLGLDPSLGMVTVSDRRDLAQFQCNGALAAAKAAGRAPRDIAEDVVGVAADPDVFSELSVAGAGFINIKLTDQFLGRWLVSVAADGRFGAQRHAGNGKVLVDFGGPNVAKAMHVGHLRASLIGDSLQKIFRWAGYDVISDIHIGDWGTQMGQLLIEVERRCLGK